MRHIIILTALAVLFIRPAAAQELYIGGAYGTTEFVGSCDTVPVDNAISLSGSQGSCEDSDRGFKLLLGAEVTKHFGFEFFFGQFGEIAIRDVDLSGTVNGRQAALTGDFGVDHSWSFGLVGIGSLPIGDNFSVFGKAGGHWWSVEGNYGEVTVDGSSIVGQFPSDDDGHDFLFGAGAQYKFDNGIAVRAEWERYFMGSSSLFDDIVGSGDDDTIHDDEIDVISLGVLYYLDGGH